MPARFEAYRETWRRHFPGWEMKFWRDADVREIANRLLSPEILQRPEWSIGIRCDMLRMELLRLYGGIYADCDIECLRPWSRLLRPGCFHVADEAPDRPNNGLLAAPPLHGLAVRLCEDWASVLPEAAGEQGYQTGEVVNLTGPERLKRAAEVWVAGCWRRRETIYDEGRTIGVMWPRGLVTFCAEAFTPQYWEKEQEPFGSHRRQHAPHAYVSHHFTGSWTEHWNGE